MLGGTCSGEVRLGAGSREEFDDVGNSSSALGGSRLLGDEALDDGC